MTVSSRAELLVRRYARELASRGRPAPLRARAAERLHPAHRLHDALATGPPERFVRGRGPRRRIP